MVNKIHFGLIPLKIFNKNEGTETVCWSSSNHDGQLKDLCLYPAD